MSFLSFILKSTFLRESIITHLKSHYFSEFNLSIPISNNYSVNLEENDSYDSFSEIFIQGEYNSYLPDIEFRKVIDIGANYGYFSLWLQSIQPDTPLESALIEASPRCLKSLKCLTSIEKLKGRFTYLPKAIGNPNKEKLSFYDRPFMAGSVLDEGDCLSQDFIPILKCEEIIETLSPTYDLIKCDIEGSEWEFLSFYESIIKNSRFFILEWHSWHSGEGGQEQIIDKINSLEFEILKLSNPHSAIGRDGKVGLLLARNLNL